MAYLIEATKHMYIIAQATDIKSEGGGMESGSRRPARPLSGIGLLAVTNCSFGNLRVAVLP